MTYSPCQEFRRALVATAAMARPAVPLHLLSGRRAPLIGSAGPLGHLDVLLRLSCHGDGRGRGVLVFDWPTTAHGHSVVRLLEGFCARCDDGGHGGDDGMQIECREDAIEGGHGATTMHLKLHFAVTAIPDAMLELLALGCRIGLPRAVEVELGRYRQRLAAAAAAGDAAAGDAAAPALASSAAPASAASAPTADGVAAAASASPRVAHCEQDKIDRIVNHADFDGELHPHVDPNGEVTTSNGEVYRLVMRRTRVGQRRQWLRVGREIAHR
ncbi:MAG: hypothetical protein KDC98_02245 [Planctomycetes bacterium]|nr:hypothetical protein [Planctomycetota bacterium]